MVESLKVKFNYDDKLCNALNKIIPKIISYYGSYYEKIFMDALNKTEIICCNNMQTIKMIIDEKHILNDTLSIINEDKNILTGKYISEPKIFYDEILNTFTIPKIDRYIILSHSYNLDSPKGIYSLTKYLCEMLKSYQNEYHLKDNIIYQKSGLKEMTKEIIKVDEYLVINPLSEVNASLEEGLTIYDAELITKLILHDSYDSLEHKNLRDLGLILHEKLFLTEAIFRQEITKSKDLEAEFVLDPGMFEKLSTLADQLLTFENMGDTNNKEDIMQSKASTLEIMPEVVDICFKKYMEMQKQNELKV